MEIENINKFSEEPSMEKLEKFRKSELIKIGEKLEMEVQRSMRKYTHQDYSSAQGGWRYDPALILPAVD